MTRHIITEEGRHDYFYMMPNLIDDLPLSVIAHRLYSHLKRVTGEGGECYQSSETLAEACRMSIGSVYNAKQELVKAGLIRIAYKENDNGGRDSHLITIEDVWKRNNAHAKAPEEVRSTSPGEVDAPNVAPTSQGEGTTSPGDGATSPGELKNTPLIRAPGRREPASPQTELDYRTAWGGAKGQLLHQMAKSWFQAYVEPLEFVSGQDGVLRLAAPDQLVRDWDASRVQTTISRLMSGMLGEPVSVEIVVGEVEE